MFAHIFLHRAFLLFAQGFDGLQDLVNVCFKYTESHYIVFNASKYTGMIFLVPFSKYFSSKLYIAGNSINFSNSVKYLGIHLNQSLTGGIDIMRQVTFLYTAGNKLRSDFSKCSVSIKNNLFRTHCSCFYASQLWCNFKSERFRRLRVAYDGSYPYVE